MVTEVDSSEIAKTRGDGHEALWLWFGLSRSSYLTLPRVLLHAMPNEWQGKMAKLLQEYDETFINWPDFGSRVVVTDPSNKLIPTPEWLVNYRRPDLEKIEELKGRKS